MRHIKKYNQLFENQQELTQEQKDWLDECTFDGSWSVNPQTGLVDVNGTFSCEGQILRDFKGVRFGDVVGDFACSANSLTSLEGAPHSVGVDFHCHDNQLTSLEGAPQKVGGDFDCSHNSITSLEGAPREIEGDFNCHSNQLVSLEGAPQRVGGDFNCSYNTLTSLKGAPQIVDGDFDCHNNQLTSLEGAPQRAGGDFDCEDNPITEWVIQVILIEMSDDGITLEQAVKELWDEIPEEDRPYLAKHHPDLPPDEKRGYEALARHKKRLI